MEGGLDIRLLGGIEILRCGRPAPIGGPKPRAALAVLTAHRGSVVSTERLCDELWGDEQPADPAAVLQSHLSRLRRVLRPEAEILARPPGYVLQVTDEAVDAGRFELLCQQAGVASDLHDVVELLERALACWRGSAFEEFAELDWVQGEAVRLDELRATAHEDLLEARLKLGADAALVGELEAAVAEHPLRERMWSQLIVALYRGGRSGEALRRAADFRALLRDELGLEPSAAFRELEARVLTDDPTLLHAVGPSRRAPPRRLPADTTSLLGRDDDLAQLVAVVRRSRLVTLTGPGGVGKTRVAMRLATELWDEFDGEVFVVELAAVHDSALTVAAIATAIDVQQRQHLSVEQTLVEYLRARTVLLVLDNCEHLRGTVAPLAQRLLAACPEIRIAATSREVLGLPVEQVWRVEPLALPPEGANPATASDSPAARLFVQRAIAARPGFAITPDNVKAIVDIVRRLDGLPLALELAAARVRAMSVSALSEHLHEGFGLLSGAQTSMIARHRTVADLVAWSHDLLDPDEQRLFAQLCVFAGTFGLDAVEGVCAADELAVANISLILANLVDKSMVQVVDENHTRYRVLETLREYGNERLDDRERREIRARHGDWYLRLVERCAEDLTGPDEARAVAVLDREFDNLRAAHLWSIEHADPDIALRLVAGLREYAFRCMHDEITGWSDAAASVPDADAHERYPVVVATAAYGRFARGDLEGAIELGERAVGASERLGVDSSGLPERVLGNAWFYRGDVLTATEWMDRMLASTRSGSPARLAHALYMRSVAFTSVGDNLRGTLFAHDAQAAAAACGSPTAHAQASYALGLALEATHPTEAAAHLQRATTTACEAGNRWIQAFSLTEVLWLEARQGRPREALGRFADVIELWYRGGDWANQWLSLRHVFGILVELRAHLGAATLHGALTAAGAAYALPFEAADAQRINALAADLREQLGAATFAAAVRRGATLNDGEIITFVRGQIEALAGS